MRTARHAKSGAPIALAADSNRDDLAAYAAVASRFEGWRPAPEVLIPVRGLRTIFPHVDLATRIGAWPIERVALVHGPSNHGKTEFCLGLGLSFLMQNCFFALVDAEYTTPADWLRSLMGRYVGHPCFTALRPRSYEETVDRVRQWAETIGDAREKGEIPRDTTGLVVIDSIRKLVPKRLLQTLLKEGAGGVERDDEDEQPRGPRGRKKKPGGIDGMGGRAAQYKAALNSQWMDEVIPLLAQTGTAMVIIAREIEDPDADPFSGKDYRLTGGKALFFDSSLVVRILLEPAGGGQVWQGEGSSRRTIGELHRVELHKTKIGGKDQKIPRCNFHTSNGLYVPEGFDRARDLVAVGEELGIVENGGGHYRFDGKRFAQGEHNAVSALYAKPALLTALDRAVRGQIEQVVKTERRRIVDGAGDDPLGLWTIAGRAASSAG